MNRPASTRLVDDTSTTAADRLVRQFEAAWRSGGDRPDLAAFLPSDPVFRNEALFALARADLALRWQARERVQVESYRERFSRAEQRRPGRARLRRVLPA